MHKLTFALGAVLLLAAASEAKPNAFSVFTKADDSCLGRCGQMDAGASCQCNTACSNFGDCCADYTDVCESCRDRCDEQYNQNNPCHCNDRCSEFNNCCDDYDAECDGGGNPGGGDGDLSNTQLKELSERLIKLNDATGINALATVDPQGSTSQCSTTDKAPNPFFTTFDESIWTDFPTVAALKNLYDNYKPAVTIEEDNTSAEQAETNAFLDAVMASDIMQETYRTLSEAKVVTGTIEDFRAQIWTLWFEGYDRDGTSANVVGSSGFEHVFMGESKGGKVSGFHNWLHWYYEEAAGNIDYLGQLSFLDFSGSGSGLTNVYKWNGQMKCIGSMFVGTLPELDLAVYTTCFLTRGGGKCTMSYNGSNFYVTTYDLVQNGAVHIGTAYPDFT